MRHRPSADDDDLTRRIAGAFERLPLPESARLDVIEDRLARALPSKPQIPRAPSWYWWLIGALAVSGAAAWWAGEYWERKLVPVLSEQPAHPAQRPSAPDAKPLAEPEYQSEQHEQQRKDPQIYRRERH